MSFHAVQGMRGVPHAGTDQPFFGNPETMLISTILAGAVFGVGSGISFLIRKFFPKEKK